MRTIDQASMRINSMHDLACSRWRRLLMLAPLLLSALVGGGCGKSDESAAAAQRTNAQPRATAANRTEAPGAQQPTPDAAAQPSSAAYAAVLAAVVTEEGRIRYAMLDNEDLRKQLDTAIDDFAKATPPADSDLAGRKALWINAFNANIMKMAYEEHRKEGFKSVNDVPGFFSERTIVVAGETITPQALRERLRGLKDPRIHSALVLAARGSPPMPSDPLMASRVDVQLDNQALRWLETRPNNYLTPQGFSMSSVFQEFAADFEGPPYNGALGFVRKHSRTNGSIRDYLRSVAEPRTSFVPFDWTLNDAGVAAP